MEKRHEAYASVDEYIASYPEDVQKLLRQLRATIKAAAPEAQEKIAYQMPAYALKGNLVYFGAFKEHIGFYPAPRSIEAFQAELAQYEGSKGTVKFPLDQPLPLDLITRIVRYRVEENLRNAEMKAKRKVKRKE